MVDAVQPLDSEQTYGNLLDCYGSDIEQYATFEHGNSRGDGTVFLDPDIGGFNSETESVYDLAREAVDGARKFWEGVSQYDVTGVGEMTAGEAVEEIIGQETSDNPLSAGSMFASAD